MSAREPAIVVYDGVCHLCNGWVNFLIARDQAEQFRFAAVQSAAGAQYLQAAGLSAVAPESLVYVEDGRIYCYTDAIMRVLWRLGGPWKLLSVFRLIPAGLRDALYRPIARRRYRLFGQYTACRLPRPADAHRFLE